MIVPQCERLCSDLYLNCYMSPEVEQWNIFIQRKADGNMYVRLEMSGDVLYVIGLTIPFVFKNDPKWLPIGVYMNAMTETVFNWECIA